MKEKIEFKAKFKKVNLFNSTLHIILYPKNGLKTVDKLYSLKEGEEITISVS